MEKVAQNNDLYLCFKTCSGSNGSFLEIDEVILSNKRILRDFSPLACVLSRNLEILTSVTNTQCQIQLAYLENLALHLIHHQDLMDSYRE